MTRAATVREPSAPPPPITSRTSWKSPAPPCRITATTLSTSPASLRSSRMRALLILASVLSLQGISALEAAEVPRAATTIKVPLGLLPIDWPRDNPYTPAKAELGKLLYFEQRLSLDDNISCATCHT